MATFDEFITSIRKEFGEQGAGKPFEVFCKWFLENDPEWSKTVDKVWLWADYPNKWQRQDLGTDLVFRDKEGLTWAVQAKCYGEHRTTTKGDMNSFLADTGRKEVDRRLWMQTTNKMEAKADKTLKGQDKPVTVFNLNSFRDAPLEYPASFADLYQAKVKAKPTPDTHQIKAIEDATAGLKTSDRGQMVMACGTGKTFTTLWIKEALEAHTTLVLLPSLSLLSQTMREWAWAGNTDFDILNVCSDKSVGKKTEDMDPADAPFPVTSEIDEIAKFLKQPKPKVVFCTYQSSDLIAQAQLDDAVPSFDLAVADEAHRCAGKADAGFATILDGENIRASKRLFTTATPRYFGKAIKDEAKARDLPVVGMDNEAVFGPVIHKLTFGQAIEQELLTDYQIVIVGVDEPMVREWIESSEIVSTTPDNQTDAGTLAAKIGLIKAIKDYDLKRVISFHSRVKGAQEFSEELSTVIDLVEPQNRPVGQFLTDYVSGAMRAGDRKEKIDRLKVLEGYDRGILTNARCLAEGVDVPSLDGVAFIDPRGSQVEIIQAVGRAIRKVRGAKIQKKGTIVLPVFIEDGEDVEKTIEESNFKPVWDVLKALRAHDEVLADTLDQYRTNMAKSASKSREAISDKIIFDLPANVDAEFSSALRTVLVEASTMSWEFWFGLLEQFKEREGHCRVFKNHETESGFKLGSWVIEQRRSKVNHSVEQVKRLSTLGFIWDPITEQWEQGFSELHRFIQSQGHCRIPRHYKSESGFALTTWVRTQRKNKSQLSTKRVERLNEIGFVWDPTKNLWDQGLMELQQYKRMNGHCSPTKNYKAESGLALGKWVQTQRQVKDHLSLEKVAKLDALCFIWDPLTEQWEQMFSDLQAFAEREGHCNVLRTFKTKNGSNLGYWVGNQRKAKSRLSTDQITRLNSLGFIWDPLTEQWEQMFSDLQAFAEREGHCNVPTSYKTKHGSNLGTWVQSQRRAENSLLTDQITRLNSLDFIWNTRTDQWEKGFEELEAYKAHEGHCNVPSRHRSANGYAVGNWVIRQRVDRDKGVLTAEQISRLSTLGFTWDLLVERWEEGFSHLTQFIQREGHSRVLSRHLTEDSFALGTWVLSQRKNKAKLPTERLQRLDDIGFVWDASKDKT